MPEGITRTDGKDRRQQGRTVFLYTTGSVRGGGWELTIDEDRWVWMDEHLVARISSPVMNRMLDKRDVAARAELCPRETFSFRPEGTAGTVSASQWSDGREKRVLLDKSTYTSWQIRGSTDANDLVRWLNGVALACQ